MSSWQERNLFETLIVYYFDLVPIEEKKLNLLMDQLPKVIKTEFVSLADHLRQKGRQEGRQEGSEHKNQTATQNMLQRGFEVSIICDVLEVTPEFVETIQKAMIKEE
jgi:predicted transposase YdaD